MRLFTFVTCIVITAGAVGDNGIVKAKRGEKLSLTLFDRKSELKIVSRLTVRRNGTQEVFRCCSHEEQNRGCKPINRGRFSLQTGHENVSITFLDANTSDEGVYDVEVIDDKNNRIHQTFTVVLTGSLETAEDFPIKGKETPWTNIPIIVWISGVIVFVINLSHLLIIYCKCGKKQQNAGDGAGDPEEVISLNLTTSGGA